MSIYPLSTLATLLMLAVYAAFATVVSRARARYGVAAPATSGHPEFDKRYRVEMNTLEQVVLTLPALWLTAVWIGDPWAALGGLVWSVGRIVYARGYYAEPGKREAGFVIGAVATVALFLAPIVAVVLRWV